MSTTPNNFPNNYDAPFAQPQKKSKAKGCLMILGIFFLGLILLGACGALVSGGDKPAAQTTTTTEAPKATEPTATPEPTKAEKQVPAEYESALEAAKLYSDTMHFSKKALYKQLTSQFDQHSPEAAKYAVENVDADWKQNALLSAKSYQETMHMSPKGIHDQLTTQFDQFTEAEADYAIEHLND